MTDAGPPPYPAPPSHDFGPPAPFGSPGQGSPGQGFADQGFPDQGFPGQGSPGAPRRRSMAWRHVVSPLVALIAAPAGLVLVDYGAGRYVQDLYRYADSGWSAELLWIVAGGLFLVLAAASARLSGLGPVLAALVWAVAPFLWFVIDARSFFDVSQDLPSTHFWFNYAPLEFPLLGALLLGAGIGGRWRGRIVAS